MTPPSLESRGDHPFHGALLSEPQAGKGGGVFTKTHTRVMIFITVLGGRRALW